MQDRDDSVNLPFPGRRTRVVVRISKSSFLIILVLLVSVAGLPIWSALSESDGEAKGTTPGELSQDPRTVGADPVPDLSLPQTVMSGVQQLIGAGGVIQESPENITLYNSLVAMRLLGLPEPHDKLLGPGGKALSTYTFWSVQAQTEEKWIPLLPTTSNFTVIGTNVTGTFLVRTMKVSGGPYSGLFRIVYKATSAGPLKWDLDFASDSPGRFRIAYDWRNLTNSVNLRSAEKRVLVSYPHSNYTLSWGDVPAAFGKIATVSQNTFSLFIDLGNMAAGSRVFIDPSIVASGVADNATAYTYQRKVFYEPEGGYYWVFYYDGNANKYRNSADGKNWSPPYDFPSGLMIDYGSPEHYLVPVFSSGQRVVIAAGQRVYFPTTTVAVSLRFREGTISGSEILWGGIEIAETLVVSCVGVCWAGMRHVNVHRASNGVLAFSYNWYAYGIAPNYNTLGVCSQSWVNSQNGVFVRYNDLPTFKPSCKTGTGYGTEQGRSIVLPSNSQGRVGVVYQFHSGSDTQLRSSWLDADGTEGPVETVDGRVMDTHEFSAVSDTDYNVHLVYRGLDGNVTSTRLSASSGSWTYYRNILSTSMTSPTMTVDNSTNDLYVLAVNNSAIVLRRRTSVGNWSDTSITYSITERINPNYLTSNLVSSSNTESSRLIMVWTEGSSPYNATFASIPIQTVWSPYSSPSDPWDRNGLAPYGQYFANLGEYVSPSTGMLTVRQTDLSVPGRGLNFEVTRVYAEPYSFLTSGPSAGPYLYETYPWAPIGNGWQLNYPWFKNSAPSYPIYLHLWDAQGYRVPSAFWKGNSAVWENHQGEHFSLIRNATGIFLRPKSGISYNFDATYKLTKIIDPLGNNITLQYSSNRISSITDTAGRVFQFCYNGNLLQTIYQTSGSCASPGTARSVSFGYSGSSLASVIDPGGRVTSYLYSATGNGNVAPWLLSRITYPTSWYTNYTYGVKELGSETTSYRISKQLVSSTSASVRRFDFVYSPLSGSDTITNSTVTTYDGSTGSLKLVGYTRYSYSFAGMTMNVSDAENKLVRGLQQRFGVNGEIPREIVMVTNSSGALGSYTNYYHYDLWGNQIYSKKAINPAANWYHESFNSYYNNGLPLGFYAFQDSFSQENYTRPDNPWWAFGGSWRVKNGALNGTSLVFEPKQREIFAWTNFTTPNLSIVSSIYLTKEMSTGDLSAGLLAHYPGSGTRKWSLVLHNVNGGKLSLYDDDLWWVAESPCTVSLNKWYKLNFTISGKRAWGKATAPGISDCSVSGSFTTNDITTATGVGLYAGRYSALFDNFTVTTVAPPITAITFSNSFYSNGGPGPNLHGSLAGSAEFTNSTGAAVYPIESYFSYHWWGGVSQTKQRYDPPPVTQPGPNTLAIDGYASALCPNTTSSCSATLTTTQPNDIVIAFAFEALDLQTSCTFSITDTASLTWMKRSGVVFGRWDGDSYRDQIQMFWARSPGALSSVTITESISGCGNNYNGLHVFAISGANFYSPFDPSPTLPGSASGQSYNTSVTLSTVNTKTMVFSAVQHGNLPALTPGPGFTIIISNPGWSAASEYQIFNSALTNINVTFSDTVSDYWVQIADALVSGPSPPTQWLTTSSIYDTYGNPKEFTDPRGNVNYFTFSGNYTYAYLTNQTRRDGSVKITTLYAYNFTTGNVRILTDPMSNATSYQNDNLGRVKKVTYALGAFIQYTYNDTANYVDVINENGWRTRQQYDGLGRLSRSERPWVISAKLRLYNVNTSSKGGDFYKTATTWSQSTLTWNNAPPTEGSMIASLGSVSVVNTWYEVNVTPLVTGNGVVSLRIRSTSSDGAWYSSKEGANPPQLVLTFMNQTQTQVRTFTPTDDAYIAADAPSSNFGSTTTLQTDNSPVQDFLLRFSVTGIGSYSNETAAYNWQNRAVNRTDAMGNPTRFRYDVLGRPTNVTTANGKSVLQSYNDLASWVMSTDQNGNRQCNIYDRLGNLVSVIEKASATCQTGTTTNYSYNEVGNLGRVTNALSRSSNYNFDNVGELTKTIYPDNSYKTYTYDRNGNLANSTDRMGVKTMHSYDSLNRIKTITYCGAPVTSSSYTYDRNSNPLIIQNQNATITYAYDARNRPLSEKYEVNLATRQVVDLGCSGTGGTSTVAGGTSKTYTVAFSYNGELLDTVTYPTLSITNIGVKYTYDGLGRVLNATKSGSPATYYARSFTYYKNDQLKGLQFGNNLIGNYSYDSLSRPSTITLSGAVTMSLAYTYNNTGTVASVTGQVNGVTVNEQYRYDSLRRLTNATVVSQGATTELWYEYDNMGNRLRQRANGAWTTYSYNQSNNELKSYTAPGLNLAYTYNKDGTRKTQTITTNSTTWAYNWNAAGYLLNVTRSGAYQGRYAYDALGRQVESIDAATTFYAYTGTETLFKNISNSFSVDYIYAAGLRIATADSSCCNNYSTVKYFHTDHLGSTRLVTTSSPALQFANGYQTFGKDNGTPTCNPQPCDPHKFTGKSYSSSTGLYYNFQRWYDPEIGRFISQDFLPGYRAYPQSLNPFLYVLNSPVSGLDPAGLDCFNGLTDFFGCAGGFLQTLGPQNQILDIFEHTTGINTNRLVGATLGPTAEQVYTGTRIVSGAAFLAMGLVAGAAVVAPMLGIGGTGSAATTAISTGASVCAKEQAVCTRGASSSLQNFAAAASRFAGQFEGRSVVIRDWAIKHIFNRHISGQGGSTVFRDIGYTTSDDIMSGLSRALQTGFRVPNNARTANPLYIAVESQDIPVRIVLNLVQDYWQVISAIPIPPL